MPYTVYEGIAQKMAELGDEPATDEVPLIPGQATVAYGVSGTQYVFIAATNTVHPFARGVRDQALGAGILPSTPQSPIPNPQPPTAILDYRGKLPVRAGAPPYPRRDLAGVIGATIHYTASPPGVSVEDVARAQLERVADPSTGAKFPAIAYHLVVPAAGFVAVCHDLDVRCWHSGAVIDRVARNASHVGICYVGNVEPNPAQLAGIRAALRWVEAQLGQPLQHVEGHRSSGYPTACPGPLMDQWLPIVKNYR